MNTRHFQQACAVSALLALGFSFGLNRALFAQPAAADAETGVQVLTRGPVHEAFAETVTFNPEPGIVVPKAPPAAIEEVPPDQRPEGDNVAWIPGYWAWNDERSDFLWVSGIWRSLPPGRQWVPGYWAESAQGYQWTSGYWANAEASEVAYLPVPPPTIEVGPNVVPPSPNDTWLPGCWVWLAGRYAWRPGYWAPVQTNWVWIPAHYVWTPYGCVFVDGYWDYSIGRRGVLFAPVYFSADVYARRGFFYSPRLVIDLGVLTDCLFLRPRYHHYYFGDYYAANYRGAGYFPWFAVNAGHVAYDPFYAYKRWEHRQDGEWERRQRVAFQERRDHEDLRPPHTWAAQRDMGLSALQGAGRFAALAAPLDVLTKSKDSPFRFQAVDSSERREFSQRALEMKQFRKKRQMLEAQATGAPAGARTKEFTPAKVRLPESPILAKPGAGLGKGQVAPPPKVERAVPPPKIERAVPPPKLERAIPPPKIEHAVPPPKIERAVPPPKIERAVPPPKLERAIPPPKIERAVPPPKIERAPGPPPSNKDKGKRTGKDGDKN